MRSATFTRKYNDSKANAKRRGIPFLITKEEYTALRSAQCVYGERIANGIDRKNNNLPYTADNCTPCCVRHNMIKGSTFTHEEMLLIVQTCASAKACGSLEEARANATRNHKGLSSSQVRSRGLTEQGRADEKGESQTKAEATLEAKLVTKDIQNNS